MLTVVVLGYVVIGLGCAWRFEWEDGWARRISTIVLWLPAAIGLLFLMVCWMLRHDQRDP